VLSELQCAAIDSCSRKTITELVHTAMTSHCRCNDAGEFVVRAYLNLVTAAAIELFVMTRHACSFSVEVLLELIRACIAHT
jgi:tRNA U34 5-carboxymethylaminomethyl modifying GTPase MnmE/TrmE